MTRTPGALWGARGALGALGGAAALWSKNVKAEQQHALQQLELLHVDVSKSHQERDASEALLQSLVVAFGQESRQLHGRILHLTREQVVRAREDAAARREARLDGEGAAQQARHEALTLQHLAQQARDAAQAQRVTDQDEREAGLRALEATLARRQSNLTRLRQEHAAAASNTEARASDVAAREAEALSGAARLQQERWVVQEMTSSLAQGQAEVNTTRKAQAAKQSELERQEAVLATRDGAVRRGAEGLAGRFMAQEEREASLDRRARGLDAREEGVKRMEDNAESDRAALRRAREEMVQVKAALQRKEEEIKRWGQEERTTLDALKADLAALEARVLAEAAALKEEVVRERAANQAAAAARQKLLDAQDGAQQHREQELQLQHKEQAQKQAALDAQDREQSQRQAALLTLAAEISRKEEEGRLAAAEVRSLLDARDRHQQQEAAALTQDQEQLVQDRAALTAAAERSEACAIMLDGREEAAKATEEKNALKAEEIEAAAAKRAKALYSKKVAAEGAAHASRMMAELARVESLKASIQDQQVLAEQQKAEADAKAAERERQYAAVEQQLKKTCAAMDERRTGMTTRQAEIDRLQARLRAGQEALVREEAWLKAWAVDLQKQHQEMAGAKMALEAEKAELAVVVDMVVSRSNSFDGGDEEGEEGEDGGGDGGDGRTVCDTTIDQGNEATMMFVGEGEHVRASTPALSEGPTPRASSASGAGGSALEDEAATSGRQLRGDACVVQPALPFNNKSFLTGTIMPVQQQQQQPLGPASPSLAACPMAAGSGTTARLRVVAPPFVPSGGGDFLKISCNASTSAAAGNSSGAVRQLRSQARPFVPACGARPCAANGHVAE